MKEAQIKDFCVKCGRPEKSRYKAPANCDFICSMCVQAMCRSRANTDEEAAKKEKVMKKRVKRAKRFKKSII